MHINDGEGKDDVVDTTDDFIVALPDDEIVHVKGSGAAQADAAGAPVNKREVKEPRARVSPLAKDRGDDVAERRRLEAIERERDEARRLAEEAQARADALAERAQQEADARLQAEDTARLREDQAMRAHWSNLEAKKSQLDVALSAQKAASAAAERAVIDATEKGDASALAAAQKALAKAETAIGQLEAGLGEADRRIEETRRLFSEHDQQREAQIAQRRQQEKERLEREAEERQRRQAQQQAPDPDAWINTTARKALGEDGAEWLRQNKAFVTDEKKNRAFLRFADQYADDYGKDALKSAEFIEALNERFSPEPGEERPARRSQQRQTEAEPEVERPRRSVAAPVSRGNQFFSSRNLNATQIKLPADLVQFARAAGLDVTEYAKGVVADIKAGKLPKTYLDPDYDRGL